MSSYVQRVKKRLPSFLNVVNGSNISKLIETLVTELDTTQSQININKNNLDIDQATLNALDKIGTNLDLERKSLSDDDYRLQLKYKIIFLTADGTINKMIEILRSQLEIDNPADIIIEELGDAKIRVTVPIDNAIFPKIETTFEFGNIGDFDQVVGFSDDLETYGGILGGFDYNPSSFNAYIELIDKIKPIGVGAEKAVTGTLEFDGDGELHGFSDDDEQIGGIFGGVL